METPKTLDQWRDAVIDARIANILRIKEGPEHLKHLLDHFARPLAALGEVSDWMVPALLKAAAEAWEASETETAAYCDFISAQLLRKCHAGELIDESDPLTVRERQPQPEENTDYEALHDLSRRRPNVGSGRRECK